MSRRAVKVAQERPRVAPAARIAAQQADRRRKIGVCAGLVAVTLLVYVQALGFGFVAWDDPAYVSENPHVRGGLSVDAIAWAFTSVHGGHWHPLTGISHMLDCQIYGLNAAG